MTLLTSSRDVTVHTLCLHLASLQPTLRMMLLTFPRPQSHQRGVERRTQSRHLLDHVLALHLDSKVQRGAATVPNYPVGQDKVG